MNDKDLERMMAKDSLLKGINNEFDTTKDKDLKTLLENDENLRTELLKEVFDRESFVTSKMAKIILNKYKMISKDGEIYYYKDGVYVSKGSERIEQICSLILDSKFKKHYVNEVIAFIQGLTMVDVIENCDKNLLCLENGIYDIETGELRPHNPDIVFLNKLPIHYDKNASCPQWEKFINEVIDSDDVVSIQEFFGYTLWRDHPFHTAFLLYGEGANGKTTLINVLKEMLGQANVTSVSIQRLCQDKFAVANLFGKLANLYADLPKNALSDTGMFKMITGHDSTPAEKKFGGQFEFINYSKQIFSCNTIPESRDDSDAFYRRWQILMFNKKFEGTNRDPEMINKLTTKDELSGIFNWSLEGLKRLIENKRFTHEKSSDIMKELYIMKSNSVRAFIDKYCEQDYESEPTRVEVYLGYKQYCKNNKLVPVQENTFGKKLLAIPDINILMTRPERDGRRVTCYKGIKLKDMSVLS